MRGSIPPMTTAGSTSAYSTNGAPPSGGPIDPDTLFAAQPHSGTHSIIDMAKGVSAKPALFTVSPLTDEQTLEFFKTRTPAPDQVVEWMKTVDPFSVRERWQGAYVVSYLDGHPEQIHFSGLSGD
ncbi:hypothetical protein [Micromonospora chersina]|uniref:hypothetical protein n=1 Tax=Micromonospora chersina TaxID=47854 RepID=UPI003721DFFC